MPEIYGPGLFRPVDELPAHNGGHHFSSEMRAVKRRIVRDGMGLCGLERPSLLGIEDRNIRNTAALQRAAMLQVKYFGRTGREQLNDAGQRNSVLAVQLRDRQCQRGLQTGNAKRGPLEFYLLFV